MYTIQFLAPFIAGLCFDNFTTKQGELCNVRQEPSSVVKYYESNKSCYVNGTFYRQCKESNGTF